MIKDIPILSFARVRHDPKITESFGRLEASIDTRQ